MSDSVNDPAKLEWLRRVLGVETAGSGGDAEQRKALLRRIHEIALMAGNLSPENRATLVKQATAAKGLAEKSDLGAAETAIEQLEAFYAKVSGPAKLEEDEGTDAEAEESGIDPEARRKELLLRVREIVMLTVNLSPEDKATVIGEANAAKALAEGSDLDGAESAIEQLAEFYAAAAGRARVDEAETVGEGRVKYRKLQLAWRAAQDGARADLEELADKVVNDPEVVEEEELYDQVVEAAGDIASLLPEFGRDLDIALDALEREGDPDEMAALHQTALSVIEEYRSRLDAADALAQMQEFAEEEYSGLASISRLSEALADLSRNIKAAAA
jgi:hypothetical protein